LKSKEGAKKISDTLKALRKIGLALPFFDILALKRKRWKEK
jgi:hypothetical protein